MQTQIRLLLQEQSDQGLHCLPISQRINLIVKILVEISQRKVLKFLKICGNFLINDNNKQKDIYSSELLIKTLLFDKGLGRTGLFKT